VLKTVPAFLDEHPGDATADYCLYHAPELVEQILPVAAHLGPVDPGSITPSRTTATAGLGLQIAGSEGEKEACPVISLPPLRNLISLDDFERVAEAHLAPNAWAYYSSAADDELTKRQNRRVFQRVYLRPRILRNVGDIDTRASILGHPSTLPIFVCPAAMAKLGHPDGECAIAAAAGHEGLIQVVSTASSIPIEKIMGARTRDDQPVFFQLYVFKDLEKTKALIRRVERAGVKALWVTVDAPVIGKRERDERVKATVQVNFTHPAAPRI
jgi:L-lactate dehydrogenase (cytochrome)